MQQEPEQQNSSAFTLPHRSTAEPQGADQNRQKYRIANKRAPGGTGTGNTDPRHNRRRSPMTGKLPPTQAITEAQKWAGTQDLMVFALEPGHVPIPLRHKRTRLHQPCLCQAPEIPGFQYLVHRVFVQNHYCTARALPICCEGINREIWVRRTAQTWYRYLNAEIPQFLEKSNEHEKNDRPDGGAEPPPFTPDHSHQAI